MIDYSLLAPATAGELVFAHGVASAAATGRTPNSGLGHLTAKARADADRTGKPQLVLSDIPSNRAMIAILREFGSAKGKSIMFRLWAMAKMVDDERIAHLKRPSEDGDGSQELHEAVWEIAGQMPLEKDGSFNAPLFCLRVLTLVDEGKK